MIFTVWLERVGLKRVGLRSWLKLASCMDVPIKTLPWGATSDRLRHSTRGHHHWQFDTTLLWHGAESPCGYPPGRPVVPVSCLVFSALAQSKTKAKGCHFKWPQKKLNTGARMRLEIISSRYSAKIDWLICVICALSTTSRMLNGAVYTDSH